MIKISEIILEKNFDKLILIGTKNHLSELERIKYLANKIIIQSETENILEVVELISKANLVVTPDTSIVHIAATFERKMLCIYRREIGKRR